MGVNKQSGRIKKTGFFLIEKYRKTPLSFVITHRKKRFRYFSFVITNQQTNQQTNRNTKKNTADSVGIRKKQFRATLRVAKIHFVVKKSYAP